MAVNVWILSWISREDAGRQILSRRGGSGKLWKLGKLLTGTMILAGCSTPAKMVVRDAPALHGVKRIAVMPFFLANDLSVESYKSGYLSRNSFDWSGFFVKQARRALSGRYEFVGGDVVDIELKKLGSYKDYDPQKGRGYRTGYTLAEAVQAGKSLQADAVLLGAAAIADRPGYARFFFRAASVRMVDVRTGTVVWGAHALQDRASDDHPIQKIVAKMRELP